mgnify:CR=1 FL=1
MSRVATGLFESAWPFDSRQRRPLYARETGREQSERATKPRARLLSSSAAKEACVQSSTTSHQVGSRTRCRRRWQLQPRAPVSLLVVQSWQNCSSRRTSGSRSPSADRRPSSSRRTSRSRMLQPVGPSDPDSVRGPCWARGADECGTYIQTRTPCSLLKASSTACTTLRGQFP